jgi:predicted permease
MLERPQSPRSSVDEDRPMHTILQDLRYAWRSLWRSPIVTTVAILSLALGVGVNTAVFSVANATLLSPLRMPGADRLFVIHRTAGGDETLFTLADVSVMREALRGVARVTASASGGVPTTRLSGVPTRVAVRFVEHGWLDVLNVGPLVGRSFTADEQRAAAPVAVVSEWTWRRHFGGEPAVLGRTLRVSGLDLSIVGVAPANATIDAGSVDFDVVTVPLSLYGRIGRAIAAHHRERDGAEARAFSIVVRLVPDASRRALESRLQALGPRLRGPGERPASTPVVVSAMPAERAAVPDYMRDDLAHALWALAAATACVLLLGCAGVAGVLLAREESRRRDAAIRSALGATRARRAREVALEAALLVASSIAIGAWLSALVLRGLSDVYLFSWAPLGSLPTMPNAGTLAFVALLSAVVVAACGLGPAWWGSRVDSGALWREAAHGYRSRRAHAWLLGAQVAISFVLLCGAAVFARSLQHGLTVDLGFEAGGVIEAWYDLDPERWTRESHLGFRRALVDEVRRVPGVSAAAIGQPVLAAFGRERGIDIDGRPADMGQDWGVRVVHVDPGFNDVLLLPLLAGRDLRDADNMVGVAPAALANQAFAARYLSGSAPLGRFVGWGHDEARRQYTVVGVVGNTRFDDLRSIERPTVYVPRETEPDYPLGGTLLVRTSGDLGPVADAIRASFRRHAPDDVPPWQIEFVEHWRRGVFEAQRTGTMLLGWLGGACLALTIVGIAGAVLFALERRRRELGVRMALGASPRQLVGEAMRTGVMPIALGLCGGSLAGAWALRFAAPYMFEVPPVDVASCAAAGVLQLVTSVLACWLPGRRAARTNPTVLLRSE